jgi:hypothetical protein
MYKIEYKRSSGSVFCECHIDEQIVPFACVKFAEYANLLESKLIQLAKDLPSEWDDYLQTLDIIELMKNKWISEEKASEIIGDKVVLDDIISLGELSFTMEGNSRIFDRNEVIYVKAKLL